MNESLLIHSIIGAVMTPSLIPDVPYSVILNKVKDLLFEERLSSLIRCSKTENVEKSSQPFIVPGCPPQVRYGKAPVQLIRGQQ